MKDKKRQDFNKTKDKKWQDFIDGLRIDCGKEPAEYPPAAFYFSVKIPVPSDKKKQQTEDTAFQEVSGIAAEVETEDYVEGGENRFVHRLPKSVKYPKLILKRGIAGSTSSLVNWCNSMLESELTKIDVRRLSVSLLNQCGDPVRSWSFENAYPVNWEVEAFNSTKNEVAIEKIELSYNYCTREI